MGKKSNLWLGLGIPFVISVPCVVWPSSFTNNNPSNAIWQVQMTCKSVRPWLKPIACTVPIDQLFIINVELISAKYWRKRKRHGNKWRFKTKRKKCIPRFRYCTILFTFRNVCVCERLLNANKNNQIIGNLHRNAYDCFIYAPNSTLDILKYINCPMLWVNAECPAISVSKFNTIIKHVALSKSLNCNFMPS